jgi:ribosomal protein S19E (S16A)
MAPSRVTLLIFLLVTLSGCNDVARIRQLKAVLSEASVLIKQDTDITQQWCDEFVKTFTPENRAQFPANRDFLRTRAAQIIKLVDESSRLNNSAAARYEEAARISGSDQRQRGMISFASGLRKTVEMNELIKSQMQMVSDERVADEKIFNEKFLHSWKLIQQKQSRREHDFAEAKRLLG